MDGISSHQCAVPPHDGDVAAASPAAARDLVARLSESATPVQMDGKADFCSPEQEKREKSVGHTAFVHKQNGFAFFEFFRIDFMRSLM